MAGIGERSIHVSIILMVVYTAAIEAPLIGKPELRQSIAYFA